MLVLEVRPIDVALEGQSRKTFHLLPLEQELPLAYELSRTFERVQRYTELVSQIIDNHVQDDHGPNQFLLNTSRC